jgi:3-deoxy-7-phosphoheptulonate synthase
VHQIKEGSQAIVGMMIESHLHAGNQPIPADLTQLKYGVSVTDACIDWDTTRSAILRARDELAPVIEARRRA